MSKRSFEVFLSLSFRIKKYMKDVSSEIVFEAGMKDWLWFSKHRGVIQSRKVDFRK